MPIRTILGVYIIIDFVALILFASSFGTLVTLALILGSGLCGVQLIRKEGRQTLSQMQASLMQGQQSLSGVMKNSAFLLGGVLMILPGPISDLLGVIMILPKLLGRRHDTSVKPTSGKVYDGKTTTDSRDKGSVIEGEYIEHHRKNDRF